MDYYLCPNCGENITEGYDFCPKCGEEIVIINNTICLKSVYDMINKILIPLENIEAGALNLEELIEENINDPYHFIEMKNNTEGKEVILNGLDESKAQLVPLKNEIDDLMDNTNNMNDFKSLTPIFGDIESRMKYMHSLLTRVLTLIDEYLNKIHQECDINQTDNNNQNHVENKETPTNNGRLLDI